MAERMYRENVAMMPSAAVMLANHGPVVAGRTVEAACNAIEELEATARLALLLRGLPARLLTDAQVADLVHIHNIEWGT